MKTKSLIFLSIIFLLISISYSAKGQNNSSETDSTGYKTFNLYFINGYAISYDMIKNDNSVIRAHLDFSGTLTDINSDGTQINGGQPDQSLTTDQKNNTWSVSLSFYYLRTFYNSDLGEVYAGIGPGFGFSKDSYFSNQSYNYAQTNSNSNSSMNSITKNFSIGFTVVLGIKSYITKSLSVFAESQLSGGKSWQKQEYSYSSNTNNISTNYSSSSTSGHGWFYNTQFFRAGISVSL
jgi:hypothetical protein